MKDAYEKLQDQWKRIWAIKAAVNLFDWDVQTQEPARAGRVSAAISAELADCLRAAVVNPENRRLLQELKDGVTDPVQQANIRRMQRLYEDMDAVSSEENRALSELAAEAVSCWQQARKKDDYEEFCPILEKLIEAQKHVAAARRKAGESLYDTMLDGYEEGYTQKRLDSFFRTLKKELGPLLQEVISRGDTVPDGFLYQYYPIEKQREFARFLAKYIGFSFERGCMGESEHPFTVAIHNKDVRISDHYYEGALEPGIFSVIHEAGHGIYEQDIEDSVAGTVCGVDLSMGVHESQSRFYENIIGRSLSFWTPLYGKLQSAFPGQLGQVSLQQFVCAVNRVKPGPVRTEADELTYSFHIMIRYELEKRLIDGDIRPRELPKLWKELYQKYLGVSPGSMVEGVLQDIHWAQGSFGYFPSYALGNAMAAQLYHQMCRELDVEELLVRGRLSVIREYLKERVHRFGRQKSMDQILKDATNETLEPKYYIDYLKEKYAHG